MMIKEIKKKFIKINIIIKESLYLVNKKENKCFLMLLNIENILM